MPRPQREVTFALALSALLVVSIAVPVAALDVGSAASLQPDNGAAAENGSLPFLDEPEAIDVTADANYTVSNLSLPDPVGPNQTIGLEATVTNSGDDTANQTVGYHFEGETLWSTTVELDPGDQFELLPWEPGTEPDAKYTVANATLPNDLENETYTHGVYTPQETENATVDARTETAFLEGEALDSQSSEPIAGANVTVDAHLADAPGVQTIERTTDENGSFEIEYAPAPANYTISVERAGYESAAVETAQVLPHLRPVPAGYRVQQRIELTPLGSVAGTVTDDSGDDVAGANVTLRDADGSGTNATNATTAPNRTVATTSADENGSYAFDDVAPGNYTVAANATDYAGNETDVTVQANQTETADLQLAPVPGTIQGTIADATGGTPIENASVTIETATGTTAATTSTDANGTYAVDGLAPGEYTIVATHADYDELSSELGLEANGTESLYLELLSRYGSIEGTVASGDDPLANATVVLQSADEYREAETAANGSYAFQELAPDDYDVRVDPAGYEATNASVRVYAGRVSTANLSAPEPANVTIDHLSASDPIEGGESLPVGVSLVNHGDVHATEQLALTVDGVGEVANESISVAAGQRTTLTLTWNTTTDHSGTYEVAATAGNATATDAVEIHQALGTLRVDLADADGTSIGGGPTVSVVENGTTVDDSTGGVFEDYSFDLLPGDEYVVEISSSEYRDRTLTGVSVVADAETEREVTLQPANGSVSGTFTSNATDAGIGGANVRLVTDDELRTTVAGENGSFAFEDVTPGNVTITVSASSYVSTQRTVTVEPNATARADLALVRATGGLEGRIVDAETDDPVAGATVSLWNGTAVRTDQTGRAGTYAFESVPTGDYSVIANATGYGTNKTSVVSIDRNETTRQDVTLDPLTVSVSVTDFQANETAERTATIDVSANVTNEGERAVNRTVWYEFDGERANETTVELARDETKRVSFEFDVDDAVPGNYTHGVYSSDENATDDISIVEPANVSIQQLVASDPIQGGDVLTVNATLYNSGGVNTSERVRLTTESDGQVDNETVHVGAGQQQNVSLVWNTTVEHAGEFDVTVDTENDSEETTAEIRQATNTVVVSPKSEGGKPIVDATVRILEDGTEVENTSQLDPEFGNFQLDVPVGDGYTVRVESPNYYTEYAYGVAVSREDNTLVVLELEGLPGSVGGSVTSATTDSRIDGVQVTLDGEVETTGDDGNYAFDDVEPGEYELAVEPSDYEPTTRNVTVGANQDVTENVSVDALSGTIRGRVFNESDGGRIEGASVELDTDTVRSTTTGEHGNYVFENVPALEEHSLTVNASEYVATNPRNIELDANEDRIYDVYIEPVPEAATYSIVDMDLPTSTTANTTYEVAATVENVGEEDGNQTVEYLREGALENRTSISLEAGAEQQVTFQVDGSDVDPGYYSHGFYTDADNRTDELAAVPAEGWTVRGAVTDAYDDESMENATVSIDADGVAPVQTDVNGTFALPGVPLPGDYTLSVPGAAYHENASVTVDVEFGTSPTADVALERRQQYVGVDTVDAPASADEGETVDVTANVTNYGTAPLYNETVTFLVDGSAAHNGTVHLNETGATEQVAFTYDADAAGSATLAVQTRNEMRAHELAVDDSDDSSGGGGLAPPGPPSPSPPPNSGDADVSILSVEASETSIVSGDTVRVDVTVQNDGGAEGSIDLSLTADGETIASETLAAPAGSNVGTTLAGSLDDPGSYDLAVEGEDAGTVEVSEGDGVESANGSSFDEEVVGDGSSDDGTPGFGLGAGIAALLGTLYAVGRSGSRGQ